MRPHRFEPSYCRPAFWPVSPAYQHPSFQHGRAVAGAARERPGEWVDLASGLTAQQANNKTYQVRTRPSVAFRPVGSFEVRKQRCEDGTFTVQVRYVGQP
jgi:hypothetical protein